MLPSPRPLSTARPRFPIRSARLSHAGDATRLDHVQPLALDLPGTVWVQQDPIVTPVYAALCAPDDVVRMPARHMRHGGLLGIRVHVEHNINVCFFPKSLYVYG